MAFTVEDVQDLYRLLAEHPEWRAQLRPLILGDEFLQVPDRLRQIEDELDEIRTILAGLSASVARISDGIERMVDRQNRMEGRMGNIEGDLLEAKYERNMREWFADYLWPIERIFREDLALLRNGKLSADEIKTVRGTDVILRGRSTGEPDTEMLLVVEISQTINVDDVERARSRAQILEKAGYRSRAAVGGYRVAPGVEDRARELGVIVDLRRFAA